ncbi:MAG: exopolyphosphatase [Actinomycetia bacterium]|nr:exopolyphosphatase [Actinomycetes bacterium]
MRIAALDLGSNSFHLLVAEVQPDGTFVPLVREKEMLRLGDAVSRHGSIPPDRLEQAITCVRRMGQIAEAAGATEIAAVATSAVRSAANGDEFVDRVETEAGIKVEVISGLREATLIFGAIRAAVVLEPPPALCFDLGGGSVEIAVGDTNGLRWATSERLGVARLTADHVHSDPIGRDDLRQLRKHLERTLQPVAEIVRPMVPGLVVGSSGTLEDIARMVAARRKADVPQSLNQFTFSREEFLSLLEVVVGSTSSERRKLPGLDARRVDLIVAGAQFLASSMDCFGFDELTISEWALREGLLLDVIGQHDPADWSDDPRAIRRSSVQGLARRCSWPEDHSRHVARLALEFFDQSAELHGMGPVDREILEYAALLHDIGEHVSTDGHHRHAAYLVAHGQLRGFSPEEVDLLGALVRWHRRGEPKAGDGMYGTLSDPDLRRLRKLTAILRVADGLDRSRNQAVVSVDVQVAPELVLVRTRAAGDVELEHWGARRKRDLFERVFARDLEIVPQPA